MAPLTDSFDLGHAAPRLRRGRARRPRGADRAARVRRPDLLRPGGPAPVRARRVAHHRPGYALRLRFDGAARRPVHALPRGRRRARRRRRARGRPARRRRRADLAVPRRAQELDVRALGARRAGAGAADPDPVQRGLPRASAPSAARTSTRDPDHEHEAEPDPRWAKLVRAEARLKPGYHSAVAYGRPQATTVPLAHQQAALAAQDLGAQPGRVPALRRAPHPAPRVRRVRHLRRPRDRRRTGGRRRLRRRRSRARPVIALDANGADGGTGGGRRGRAPLRRAACCVFGPGELARRGDGVVDAPGGSPATSSPSAPCARSPDASIVQAAARRRRRPRRGARVGRQHRPDARRGHAGDQAHQGRPPARAGRAAARSRPSRCCCSTAAPTSRSAPSTWSSSPTWARRSWRSCMGVERPSVGPALGRRGERQGHARTCSRRASGWSGGPLNFAGNVEGFDLPGAGADVVVADGFTGNVALKVLEGTSRVVARRHPRRHHARGRCPALGGLLIRGARRAAARRARPRERGRRDPARPAQAGRGGARQLRPRRASPAPSGWPGGRSTSDMVERTARRAARPRAHCGPRPLVASPA